MSAGTLLGKSGAGLGDAGSFLQACPRQAEPPDARRFLGSVFSLPQTPEWLSVMPHRTISSLEGILGSFLSVSGGRGMHNLQNQQFYKPKL